MSQPPRTLPLWRRTTDRTVMAGAHPYRGPVGSGGPLDARVRVDGLRVALDAPGVQRCDLAACCGSVADLAHAAVVARTAARKGR